MTNYVKHSNAEYVMPFLFVHDIYIAVLDELLKDEVNPIKYVYGTVKSEWSGGRISCLSWQNLNSIEKYIDNLVNKYNVVPTFTFTNITMTKERLNDEFCNNLLDIAYEKGCHFIVASDELYKHITKRYKDAHMVCSVIVPSIKLHEPFFNETKFYNAMLDKYEIVVLRPEYTMENINNLNKLIKDVSRVEVLVNQNCHWNCNAAKLHYKTNKQLECNKISLKEFSDKVASFCPKNKPGYKSVYMNDEMVQKCIDQGITKLKIQGRDNYNALNFLKNYLYQEFFNNEIPYETIEHEIYKIISELVFAHKTIALQMLSI